MVDIGRRYFGDGTGASAMPQSALDFRLADVVAASQEGFMLVGRVDAQGALLVGCDVFPSAFFEYQLRKGFSRLAYVERFAAPACRK